jgi:hypothetical protein
MVSMVSLLFSRVGSTQSLVEEAERPFKDRQHLMAAAADGDQGFERLLAELIRVLLVMHFEIFRAFPHINRWE